MEFSGNGLHAEDEQKEVERIERPTKEGGHKRMALGAGQLPEMADRGHRVEHIKPCSRFVEPRPPRVELLSMPKSLPSGLSPQPSWGGDARETFKNICCNE